MKINGSWPQQKGISLIELMVGITVALIIMSGVITVVVNNSRASMDNIDAVRLSSQARSVVDYIHRELQRAGYVDAWTGDGVDDDITTDFDTALVAVAGQVNLDGCAGTVCNCIIYRYDLNDDGVMQNNEAFAIRADGGGVQRQLVDIAATECPANGWQPLTDSEINVSTLTFEFAPAEYALYEVNPDDVETPVPDYDTCSSGNQCLERRKVNIRLVGNLVNDPAVTVEINDEVKIKNDWFYQGP